MKSYNPLFRFGLNFVACSYLLGVSSSAFPDEPKSKPKTEHSHEEDSHTGESVHEDEHEEEESRATVGPDKGVTAFSEHDGFKLSKEANAAFGIRSIPLPTSGRLKLPKSSLILSGASASVFRIRKESFKRIPAKLIARAPDLVEVQVTDPQSGDLVVTHGAPSLRVAEMDIEGGDEAGHSH